MDEECCICFNPTTNLIDPCGHLMCKECILTWCRKTISCPLCKTTLLAPCSMSDLEPVKSPTVFFGVAPSQQVGVTISNISDASQRGVRVKNMVKDGHGRSRSAQTKSGISESENICGFYHGVLPHSGYSYEKFVSN